MQHARSGCPALTMTTATTMRVTTSQSPPKQRRQQNRPLPRRHQSRPLPPSFSHPSRLPKSKSPPSSRLSASPPSPTMTTTMCSRSREGPAGRQKAISPVKPSCRRRWPWALAASRASRPHCRRPLRLRHHRPYRPRSSRRTRRFRSKSVRPIAPRKRACRCPTRRASRPQLLLRRRRPWRRHHHRLPLHRCLRCRRWDERTTQRVEGC